MSQRPKILVIDDDAPILILMRSLLKEFGFEPVTASSGEEGLQEANRQAPDLILLDRNMPGMSGDEVLRQLRRCEDLRQTPVLILSGEPIPATEIEEIGATAAVMKPFDVTHLVSTIRSYVGA